MASHKQPVAMTTCLTEQSAGTLWCCRLDEARRALTESREKVDRQNQQLSDYEAEINLLRRRVEQLENDRDKDKKLIAQLQDTLNRTRAVRLVLLLS